MRTTSQNDKPYLIERLDVMQKGGEIRQSRRCVARVTVNLPAAAISRVSAREEIRVNYKIIYI